MRVMMSDVEMPSVLWVGANMPKVGEKDPGQLEPDTGQKAAATSIRKQLLLSRVHFLTALTSLSSNVQYQSRPFWDA